MSVLVRYPVPHLPPPRQMPATILPKNGFTLTSIVQTFIAWIQDRF